MGSLVIKIDQPTIGKLKNMHHYSDIDMFKLVKSKPNKIDDVPMIYDVEAVKQSLRNILLWKVGESVIRPEFGHNIHKSMYQQIDRFNMDEVGQEIKRAIEDNEPRVVVKSVAVRKSEDDVNALDVQVSYIVKGSKTNDAQLIEEARIYGK